MVADDFAAAARAQRLDTLLAAFPDEFAAAVELAAEQSAALARLPLNAADAP